MNDLSSQSHDNLDNRINLFLTGAAVELQDAYRGALSFFDFNYISSHQIGKQICLRGLDDPGYPPGDRVIYDYFFKLHNDNDLSIFTHAAIARFLGAAHTTMLKWLLATQTNRNAEQLLFYWYTLMEGSAVRTEREKFFREVVNLSNSVSHWRSQFILKLMSKVARRGDGTSQHFKPPEAGRP